MADLKLLYEKQGFKNIKTYIQSGNVIFESNKQSTSSLEKVIQQAIKLHYGFDVPVIIRSLNEFKKLLETNPFLTDEKTNVDKLHVTFLSKEPAAQELLAIQVYDYTPDKFKIIDQHVFLYCPDSYGETKLSNKFFESKLKVSATTRNWKTINALVDLAIDE
jgi:uncharacterized protein (DUF1697 family)